MNEKIIFLPVLIHISLTIALYIYLATTKKKAIRLGQVNEDRRSLYEDAWPESVIKINNNIRSQFEVPILFYALIFILWELQPIHLGVHLLAWLFVITRCIHSYIHTGSNYVPFRRRIFTTGVFIICILTCFAFYSLLT